MSDDNQTTGGGRSLGGGSAEPLPSSWSRPSERPRVGRIGDWSGSRYSALFWMFWNAADIEKSDNRGGASRFGSIANLGGGGGGPGAVDDDEDDEEEEENRESWFAGGERRCRRMSNFSRLELIFHCLVVYRLRIQIDKGQCLEATWFAIF